MEIKKVLEFDSIKLSIASPEQIMKWSHGEILKPETINYRTQRPEKDGLFCEKIFGPTKDWECYCGKYKKIRYKGIVCDRCGVEVTRQLVRRERMGHITLCTPVSHIWYLKGVPSSVGLVLGLSTKDLEKIAYFHSFIIIEVNEQLKKEALKGIEDEFKARKQKIQKEAASAKEAEREIKALEDLKAIAKDDLKTISPFGVVSDVKYRELSIKYGEVFKAGIGAEALKELLSRIDLDNLIKELKIEVLNSIGQKRKKALRRLKLIEGLVSADIKPEWMIITQLPVIPPELRPMVQLDGGRFAASDLNDLYRRVINRNNRLKKLMNLDAPEIILRNEKRMLQEAVDGLIDSSYKKDRQGQVAGQKRKLKSLTDMLKGKQGRFRQNLLGKRVDYSGRAVIVVGPELKLHQCGLPKMMALELFKPFVIGKLIKDAIAHNVKGAARMIEKENPEVWDALDEVIKDKFVLLNRAPTLHRLGIQAFRPILIEGMAIQIHPLVCSAFNADFDGDQMAVHLPLSKMAQEEAKNIMLSKENVLKPSSGEPIVNPNQDIVFGIYWLTKQKPSVLGEGRAFGSDKEAIIAYQLREISLQAKIKVILPKIGVIETTAGRIMFNRILPEGMDYINELISKKPLQKLVMSIFELYGKEELVRFVDSAKDLGFKYSTRSGLTMSMDDFQIPAAKKEIMKAAQERATHMRQQFNQGLITERERYTKMLNVWAEAKETIQKAMEKEMSPWKTMSLLLESGARGDTTQFTQIAGMKGNVVNAGGHVIELPVKANYKEGLSALEYFITTHGARKTLSDTALKTAEAGYLTRRLVDVSQDVIIREDDCGEKEGVELDLIMTEDMEEFKERIYGRLLSKDVIDTKTGEVMVKKGQLIDKEIIEKILKTQPEKVYIRSVISCKGKEGLCKKCYGIDLATGSMVEKGAAVGIIAAQSIGEPGTQLTMRTTHTGGVAGTADITQGLPRVEELFEARQPKGQAILAEIEGIVEVKEEEEVVTIGLVSANIEKNEYDVTGHLIEVRNGVLVQKGEVLARKEGTKPVKATSEGMVKISKDKTQLTVTKEALFKEYRVSRSLGVRVKSRDRVTVGQQLTDGSWNLQDALSLLGEKIVQKYIISEVRSIYASQGVSISDKHIEIIVRQMFSRAMIEEPNDTTFIVGEIVSRNSLEKENRRVKAKKGKEADSENLLLSITKVSLSTDSFLSAASFQETSKILIEASTKGKVDELKGLKENVIIGKLIPVGTGYTEKQR